MGLLSKKMKHLSDTVNRMAAMLVRVTRHVLTLWFPGLVIVAVSATITNIDHNCCRNGNKYGFISSFY